MVESRPRLRSLLLWTGTDGEDTLDRLVLACDRTGSLEISAMLFICSYYTVALRRIVNEDDVKKSETVENMLYVLHHYRSKATGRELNSLNLAWNFPIFLERI
jgi:hypothetical protein